MAHRANIPIGLVGASGAGKTYLAKAVAARGIATYVPSVTTREPRDGEQDGVDRFFVDHEEFAALKATGALVCVAQAFGAFYGHRIDLLRQPGVVVFEVLREYVGEMSSVFPESRFIRIDSAQPDASAAVAQSRAKTDSEAVERTALAGQPPKWDRPVFLNRFDAESVDRFGDLVRSMAAF